MLFNSSSFLVFFAVFYCLYLLLKRHFRIQNLLILIASYIFYGTWDWRFLSLLLLTTIVDYTAGRTISAADDTTSAGRRRRKIALIVSLGMNLSLLGFFKYFNFFASSFGTFLHGLGFQADFVTLNVILPVGISFYTFQSMSYTIDVYRKVIKAETDLLTFATFVAFFPQLVAGPIERAKHMLPQFRVERKITAEQVNTGIYLIIWGLFKKMVIADRLAGVANEIFRNYTSYHGVDLLLGVLAFTFQIYCDFSAYSDIARGVAKLMGFELMVNFRLPYFALNPTDFWARWHISLSTWLRDYLYIPLGGNRKGSLKTYRNLFLTMLLGGLWHGAAWNFIIWGSYHGIILILYRIFEKQPMHKDPWGGKYRYPVVILKLLLMFLLAMLGWLFFRASSVDQIVYFLAHLSLATSSQTMGWLLLLVIVVAPLMIVEVYQYLTTDMLIITKNPTLVRLAFYVILVSAIVFFGVREHSEFIYFQF